MKITLKNKPETRRSVKTLADLTNFTMYWVRCKSKLFGYTKEFLTVKCALDVMFMNMERQGHITYITQKEASNFEVLEYREVKGLEVQL